MISCAEDDSKWREIQEARAEEKAEALQIEKHFEEEYDDRTEKLSGHQDAGRD